MPKKSDQNVIVSEIKRVEKSLRTEFKRGERALRSEMLRVENKVEKLEDKMKEQHNKVMTSISNFAGRVETLEKENEVGADQTRELRVQVNSHEARISKLEPATQ